MSRGITLLLVLALQACSLLGIDDDWSEFTVELGGAGTRGTPGGEAVRINNSPYDPGGMAGIEVEITGIDGLPSNLTLTGADFRQLPYYTHEWKTRLPDSGHVGFVVRLRDRGRHLVAEEISGSFTIEPRVSWRLELDRSPFRGDDIRDPLCPDPWGRCHQLWVLEIREGARNYPSEYLWVELYRLPHFDCPKDAVCM